MHHRNVCIKEKGEESQPRASMKTKEVLRGSDLNDTAAAVALLYIRTI